MSPFDFDNGFGYSTRGDVGYPVENGFAGNAPERQPSTPIPQHFEKEPLTDFQRYVSASVGQVLPIYGASLFERVPATFAPVDHVPVGPNYVIAPGDELQVVMWGQFNFSRRFVVSRTGELTVPEAGPVMVAGLNDAQATAALKQAMSHLYRNFDLSITFGRLHAIQVFVVGEARRPGSYSVSSLSTLVNAVFASGGPSARGSMRDIELKRNGTTVCKFDLYDLLLDGDKSRDARLEPGDVILIRPAGPRIAVTGSIERPGIYEMREGDMLGDVLKLADGLSPVAATKQVVLERVADGSALTTLRIALDKAGLCTELQAGDIVRVLPIVPRFENTVTLRGNVADPGRFPWHPGMRLSELLPEKEALITRDYWKERNKAFTLPEESTKEDTSANADTATQKGPAQATTQEPALQHAAYREETRNPQGDSSLGAAMSIDDVPPLRQFTPRNTVQPAAPDIDWEYASIERTDRSTLATHIIPFHLGKLVLNHDPGEDLPLERGDVVTIFSKADFSVPRAQQSKQVRLEGEIARAGVYTVRPGETLRELVHRAGGITGNAYLYGAQFTRESTRREQQKRYDDFLSQFEREINEAASNLSSRVTSPQQAATAQTSLASQRDLVERLRKVSMNGRIVLDMQPNSHGEAALPDLPLENGDRLYIPSRPSTVNVIGNVFEQASFLYQEDLRTGDYLKKAGGPERSADRSHMFVIRADGSVVSRSTGSVLFGKSFDALHMYPGDTLVVPAYINKSTFVRNLTDWSQIFTNLALGAAAVNVLH
jgi:polysaccharide biosynthesis/export protein